MYRYAPDYQQAAEPIIKAMAGQPPAPDSQTVVELQPQLDSFMATAQKPFPPGIEQKQYEVTVPGGSGGSGGSGKTVTVTRFATAAQLAAKDQPAAVYLHPGGMICGSVPLLASSIAWQAHDTGVQHWAVHYTLSPAATAPAALEEGYAVLAHLSAHAAELGLDAARLAVAGASAGGGLAAGLGLLARDRGLQPPVAKLVLLYPMLDDRTVQAHPPRGVAAAHDAWGLRPFLTWTCEQNALAWAAYLGLGDAQTDDARTCAAHLARAQAAGADAVAPGDARYAIPARAATLAGLPSVYMDCGGLDLFVEEDSQFAARLAADGVEVEYHLFRGVPHSFEVMGAASSTAQTALALRKAAFNIYAGDALTSAFATELAGEACFRAPKVKAWGFGHTHYNCDFVVGRGWGAAPLRLVTNQRGYYFDQAAGYDNDKILWAGA